jgi:hypothetical protein
MKQANFHELNVDLGDFGLLTAKQLKILLGLSNKFDNRSDFWLLKSKLQSDRH